MKSALDKTRRILVLGSTGSIGTQAVDIMLNNPQFTCAGLACGTNFSLMNEQAMQLGVKEVYCAAHPEHNACDTLVDFVSTTDFDVLLVALAVDENSFDDASRAVTFALEQGKTVAIASKELLVVDGDRFAQAEKLGGGRLVPVDSEHSAIYQCLEGANGNPAKKILLTASGGAFRDYSESELENMTAELALNHPVWKMGKKVTIDSATLMNKSLEIVEAIRLFGVKPEQIEVILHRESIVHSMVEFEDGSVIAQLGVPDMRTPIQYALTYPARLPALGKRLDLTKVGALHFDVPNVELFPCLHLVPEAFGAGRVALAAVVAADAIAVSLFLAGKITFGGIYRILRAVLDKFSNEPCQKENEPYSVIYGRVSKYISCVLGDIC